MGRGASAKRVVQPDVLVVGIDVPKGWHIAAFRRADGWRLGRLRFSNDRSGFERLLEQAEYLREGRGCRSVAFTLEATGHYGHAVQGFLLERGHLVLRVNPAHTRRAKELEDNSREKSDPKDAEVIADLAAQGKGAKPEFSNPTGGEPRHIGAEVRAQRRESRAGASGDRQRLSCSRLFRCLPGSAARYTHCREPGLLFPIHRGTGRQTWRGCSNEIRRFRLASAPSDAPTPLGRVGQAHGASPKARPARLPFPTHPRTLSSAPCVALFGIVHPHPGV